MTDNTLVAAVTSRIDALHEAVDAVASTAPHLWTHVATSLERIAATSKNVDVTNKAFAFNGGKDSMVVLELLTAIYGSDLSAMPVFRVARRDDFDELTQFCARVAAERQLNYRVCDMSVLRKRDNDANLRFDIAFMGQRTIDPGVSDMRVCEASTPDYAPFLRVNPIIDWSYDDVWAFLDAVNAPVCSLYERGYTSVGGTSDTVANELLRRADGTYAHARTLADGRRERAGRSIE